MDGAKMVTDSFLETTREEKAKFYDLWCKQYDEDMQALAYRGPAIVANVLDTLYPRTKATVRILDVAAGTGLVGEQLAKKGFIKLDALDPSQGMLAEAKAKGVYQELICSYFDEKEIAPDTYDVITICGGCSNSHIPLDCMREAVRLLKPGGYFIVAMRHVLLESVEEYRGQFEPLLDRIEKEEKWRKISREIIPDYHKGKEGIVFIYQIK